MSKELNLNLEGMTCGHCVVAVTNELAKLPGATNIEVDLETQSAKLRTDDSVVESQVTAAIDEAGYKLVSIA